MTTQEQNGLTVEDLIPLFEYLESSQGLNPRGSLEDGTFTWTCDGSLRKTNRWLWRHRDEYDADLVHEFLAAHGSACDCEVLLNCASLLDTDD